MPSTPTETSTTCASRRETFSTLSGPRPRCERPDDSVDRWTAAQPSDEDVGPDGRNRQTDLFPGDLGAQRAMEGMTTRGVVGPDLHDGRSGTLARVPLDPETDLPVTTSFETGKCQLYLATRSSQQTRPSPPSHQTKSKVGLTKFQLTGLHIQKAGLTRNLSLSMLKNRRLLRAATWNRTKTYMHL